MHGRACAGCRANGFATGLSETAVTSVVKTDCVLTLLAAANASRMGQPVGCLWVQYEVHVHSSSVLIDLRIRHVFLTSNHVLYMGFSDGQAGS